MKQLRSLLLPVTFTLLCLPSFAQNKAVQNSPIQVIQFHLQHRCVNCLRMEKFTRESLRKYFPGVSFQLVNVEEKKNSKTVTEFQATGTALFFYNSKSGKKKDFTAFAFLNVGDQAKFETAFKNALEAFINS
jgi:hypothetical protein